MVSLTARNQAGRLGRAPVAGATEWRPVAWFVGAVFTLIAVDWLVNATRFWSDPFGAASQAGSPLVLAPLLILMPAALLVSVAAVVVRFAQSSG